MKFPKLSDVDKKLTLETPAFETLYGGQFTLSTQLIKPNDLVQLPPTQRHSFFRTYPLINEQGKKNLRQTSSKNVSECICNNPFFRPHIKNFHFIFKGTD